MRCVCEWHKNADVWAAQHPHSTPASGPKSTGREQKGRKNPNTSAEANWCQMGSLAILKQVTRFGIQFLLLRKMALNSKQFCCKMMQARKNRYQLGVRKLFSNM